MKKIKHILEVYSFNLESELLVNYYGDILNFKEQKKYHLDNARAIIYINNKTKFILNNRNLSFLITNDNLKIFDSKLRIIDNTDKHLLLYDRTNQTKLIYSFSETKNILVSEKELGYFINDNFLITDFNSIIKLIDFSEVVLLEFPLSRLGTFKEGILEKEYKVMEFSGIYKNILVCTLNSGGILLLDIEKGEVQSFFDMVGVRRNMYAKSEGSPIYYGLSFRTFIEIDVEKGKIIRQIDLNAQLKQLVNIPEDKANWSDIGTSIYKEGLFYFYTDNNILGIFDPKTEKIVEDYQFKFKDRYTQFKAGKENIQVKGNKVYCLDTSNTLHILEREYIGN